jgi:hypothetical protein
MNIILAFVIFPLVLFRRGWLVPTRKEFVFDLASQDSEHDATRARGKILATDLLRNRSCKGFMDRDS